MKRNTLLLTLFLVCLFVSSSSYAGYRVQGQFSCVNVLKYEEQDDGVAKMLITRWFEGYYTGKNHLTNYVTSSPPDRKTIYYAILKYCNENPKKDTDDAAIKIYQQLTK